MSWKVPAILYYARRNLNAKYNLVSECRGWKWRRGRRRRSRLMALPPLPAVKNPIEANVLLAEASLARKQRKCHATFIPLMLSEMPQAGDLVGLDAEFVTLNEVRGTRGHRDSPGAPGAGAHRALASPAAGGGRAAQRRHQIHHQAQPDVGGQDHVRARAGTQRGRPLHRRLHLHAGAGTGSPPAPTGDTVTTLTPPPPSPVP